MKRDLHRELSERVAAMIEAGTPPWRKDWNTSGGSLFPLRSTGERYRGVNVLLLWASAAERGFAAPHWMTFKQALAQGAAVRKGEKGTQVVYVGRVERDGDEIDPDTGAPVKVGAAFLKAYTVFNVEQIDGLEAHWFPQPATRTSWTDDARARDYFAAVPATVHHRGEQAFYHPASDTVTMPPRDLFADAAGYYSVLAHELVHWTGAPHRLDRAKGHRFGDARYAFEELVAEMGAVFALAHCGLAADPSDNNAAYLAGWAQCLRDEPRALFKAATMAEAAIEYFEGFQHGASVAA